GATPQAWIADGVAPERIDDAWHALAACAGSCIGVAPLPQSAGTPGAPARLHGEPLAVLPPPRFIADRWRIRSFTRRLSAAISGRAATDHDGRVPDVLRPGPAPAELDADDILRFPRGANAGECLHAMFERADFADRETWDDAIARALAAYPQAIAGVPRAES